MAESEAERQERELRESLANAQDVSSTNAPANDQVAETSQVNLPPVQTLSGGYVPPSPSSVGWSSSPPESPLPSPNFIIAPLSFSRRRSWSPSMRIEPLSFSKEDRPAPLALVQKDDPDLLLQEQTPRPFASRMQYFGEARVEGEIPEMYDPTKLYPWEWTASSGQPPPDPNLSGQDPQGDPKNPFQKADPGSPVNNGRPKRAPTVGDNFSDNAPRSPVEDRNAASYFSGQQMIDDARREGKIPEDALAKLEKMIRETKPLVTGNKLVVPPVNEATVRVLFCFWELTLTRYSFLKNGENGFSVLAMPKCLPTFEQFGRLNEL